MSVEGGHFVDLCQRQSHQLGQCGQVFAGQTREPVLDQVQIFDQLGALKHLLGEERANFRYRVGLRLAPFGKRDGSATAPAGVMKFFNFSH